MHVLHHTELITTLQMLMAVNKEICNAYDNKKEGR